MKTLVLSMISIAATVAAMTACTSEGDPIDNIDNGQPVEIQLNAGVITTKSAITSDEAGKLENDLANVHFYRIDGDNPDWTKGTPNAFTGKILASNQKISLNESQYYPANGDKTTIAGLYVGDATSTPPSQTAGVTNIGITGVEDILYATPVDMGNRKNQTNTPLGFKHLLTQFKFKVKIDKVTVTSEINNISITVNKANTTATMALNDGSINAWSTPKEIAGPTGLTATADGTDSEVSSGIMLEPNLGSIELIIKGTGLPDDGLTTTINGSDGDKFLIGKAYEITLTFKAREISGTATVAKWETGKPAEGEVI